MGIQLEWDDSAKTILRCVFESEWTWDDLHQIATEVKTITDSSPYTIAAIIDLSKGMTIPGGNLFSPSTFENARQLLTLGEGETGPIVVVGANRLIKMVYETFKGIDQRASAADVTFAETIEEARAHLAQVHQPKASED